MYLADKYEQCNTNETLDKSDEDKVEKNKTKCNY